MNTSSPSRWRASTTDAVKLYLMREQRNEVHVEYVELRNVPVIQKHAMLRGGGLWLWAAQFVVCRIWVVDLNSLLHWGGHSRGARGQGRRVGTPNWEVDLGMTLLSCNVPGGDILLELGLLYCVSRIVFHMHFCLFQRDWFLIWGLYCWVYF